MSKKRIPINTPIPDLNTPWDNGTSAYTGQRVEEFIKDQLYQRAAVSYFDQQNMVLLGFATEEDKNLYIENGDSTLIVSSTPFTFSGAINQIKVTSLSGSSSIYFTTSQEEAIIGVSILSQQKGITDSTWQIVDEDFRVSVQIDRGATGNYETVRSDIFVFSGNDFEIDVKDWLATGNNRIRIIAEGVQTGESGTLNMSAYLTTMYLQASDFAWHTPFIEGRAYSLGGMKIGGNIPKTLIVTVSNENEYFVKYEQSLGTNTYINTPYYFSEMAFPSGGTGIYNVELWLSAEGIVSDHLKYNIMCIAESDIMTAQLVAISDIKNPVENYSENTLFKYVCYDGGATSTNVNLQVRALVNQSPTLVQSGVLQNVTTAQQHELVIPLEIETEETNLKLDTIISIGSCEQQSVVDIDNSRSFPATSGASFYINPASRSNTDENRDKIVNAANPSATPLKAEWTDMTWMSDGWTTDDSGRKCLLIPAGTECTIPIKLLANNINKSIEIAFKTDNISNYDEPVITICEDVAAAEPYWVGMKTYPTKTVLHSNALHSNDLQQSYDFTEGQLTDIIFSIAKPYRNANYGNIAFIYCNGVKKCTFPFANTDSFVNNGYLKLGSTSADLYIYKVRGYDKAIESNDACKNFINSLPTILEKQAAQNKIDEVINDSYQVDYDKVFGVKNTMVVEMLDGASLPHYGLSKEYSARANVDFNFIKDYQYNNNDYTSWAFSLLNVEFTGQGSTSMNYWLWNLRMRPDKTKNPGCTIVYGDGRPNSDNKHVIFDPTSDRPTVGRITAKKNYASSTQSHKMGATAAFNVLHETVFDTDTNTCVAVYQEPVYAFQKKPIEGTSQYTYEFIGLYTVGPDKGDKNTFGYEGNEELALEGLNHNIMGVGYDYPWSELQYVHENEAICAKKANNEYDKAIEVSQAGSAETEADITAKVDAEFKPAYELLYNCSTMLIGVTETIDEVNADVNTWRLRNDADGNSYQRYEFWTDGDYRVFYFNIRTGQYEYNGINLLTQLNIEESALSGMSIDEKNETFKTARRALFKASAANYWDVQDNLFCICFLFIFGATDNFKKNSYPQKLKLLTNGGRWKQRQDDLDTIFKTDNQGLYSKTYSIEMFDWTDAQKTAYVFKGEDSRWVRLFAESYPDEFAAMGRSILAAMYTLGSGDNTLERLKNFFNKYFFNKAQYYFAKSAYNYDAEISYEEAYPKYVDGSYSVDVSPLAQSKGDATEAELEWLEKRIIYICSYFKYGMFGSASDASCGRITFRTQQQQSFTLTPAIDLYPAIAYGESNSKQSAQERINAGDSVTLNNVGGSNTNVYIMASDWLSDIGDLSKLAVDSSSDPAIAVSGKRLLGLKVGDEDANEVTSNLAELRIGSCPSMVEVDARNLSSLTGSVNLTGCGRLKNAYFGGTAITGVNIKPGARIVNLELPSTITALDLQGLKHLQNFDYSELLNVGYLRIEDTMEERFVPTFTLINNYKISTSGTKTSDSSYSYTSPIFLKKGQTIRYTSSSYSVGNISITNATGSTYTVVLTHNTSSASVYESLEYKATDDCYICLCTRTAAFSQSDPIIYNTAFSLLKQLYNAENSRLKDIRLIGFEYDGDTTDTQMITNLANDVDKNGNAHAYNGIDVDGNADESLLPILEGTLNIAGSIYKSNGIAIQNNFPRLALNVLGGYYMEFVDPIVQDVLMSNYGDGIGIKEEEITSIDILSNNMFRGKAIETFDEFEQFTALKTIFYNAFKNCTSLRSIKLPPNLTSIDSDVFYNDALIEEIILPQTITHISNGAFYGCTGLKTINLPLLEYIGTDIGYSNNKGTFESSGIESIENLGVITSIPDGGVSGVGLASSGVFYMCQSLQSVVLPPTLTRIGKHAFDGCSNLNSVYISDLSSWCKISFSNFGSNPLYLAKHLFLNSVEITELIIPNDITTILSYAFAGGALTSVYIHDNVTSIATSSFAYCSNLVSFVCNATTPPTLNSTAFNNTNSTFIIYVPDDSVEAYKAASNWSSYASRIKGISELPNEENED